MAESPYRTRSQTSKAPSSITTAAEARPPSPRSPSDTLATVETRDLQDTELATPNEAPDVSYPPAPNERPVKPLPEADRGAAAYSFLLAAFMVETVVWGVPSAYGVFLNYYQHRALDSSSSFHRGASLLPLVGTFSSGLMYLLGPPVALILNPRPRWRATAIRTGAVITVLALLASSFAETTWQLLLTQGVLYSIGGSLVYYSTFHLLSGWFIARRGFANGVCFAGTAAGGLMYPFVLEALLSKYGAAVTLRSLAVTTALLLSLAMPLLRPRVPLPPRSAHAPTRDHPSAGGDSEGKRKKLWQSKRLWIFMVANFAQAVGYFLPNLYLPTFATSLGLTGAQGSAMLACVNASAVISRVYLGYISDRLSPHMIGGVTMAAASIGVLVLWGVTSTSFAPLLVFSLMLGLAAGGWTSLYSSVIKEAAKDDTSLTTTLFGLLSFTRGLGSILTAPISSALIAHPLTSAKSTGYSVDGGRYGGLVLVAGVSLGVAAAAECVVVLGGKGLKAR